MMKPGSRDINEELPALHDAFQDLRQLADQWANAPVPSLEGITLHVDEQLPETPQPDVDAVVAAVEKYLEEYNQLPEESALRGPFFR